LLRAASSKGVALFVRKSEYEEHITYFQLYTIDQCDIRDPLTVVFDAIGGTVIKHDVACLRELFTLNMAVPIRSRKLKILTRHQ
tara:strand:+ start:831 stop:1082 length:252 start_codon:yes stop_codon:yes gene_type:complete